MTARKILLLLLLAAFSAPAGASAFPERQISFSGLTPANGLSQISVNDIYIDEFGAVWMGTRDGLNRYDGNRIEVFRLEKDNPYSLFCNTVLRLAGDGAGRIWALCNDGVSELDLRTLRFRTIYPRPCRSLCFGEGSLFLACDDEILRLGPTGESETIVETDSGIRDVLCSGGYLYWGEDGGGFFCCRTDGLDRRQICEAGRISRISVDSAGNLWVGTWEDGLLKLTPEGRISTFRHVPGREDCISSDFVRCCCEDDSGMLWIGTFKGLDRYDPRSGAFSHFRAGQDSGSGLTHSSVWCIRKDAQGSIWLGTYFGGVNWFHPEYEVYSRYKAAPDGLSFPVVGRIVEDGNHNLWIATEGGGLDYLDRSTGRFRSFTQKDGLSANNVKSLYYDAEGSVLWIGTHIGGLDRMDLKTGRISVYRASPGQPDRIPSDIIRDIEPWKDSLVLATQEGVCMFDRRTGRCRQLLKDTEEGRAVSMVADILVDAGGALWVAATGKGVFRHRFSTGKTEFFSHDASDPASISNNTVNNMMQDRDGRLWFSTAGSGLDLYDPGTGGFRNYDSASCGLLSDCIYQACESPFSKKLLLISNNGFSVFDPVTCTARNYDRENGFPLSSVNENAMCLTTDDEVFLGGPEGMVSFREGSQEIPRKSYSIVFTRLHAAGREVLPGDGSGILDEALPYTRRIVLPHKVPMFSVEFAADNYIAANRDEFVYRLEGFSDNWNECRGNVISYSNLSPGRYTLTVKPSGKTETVCEPAVLGIRVLPPWYGTWWAMLLFISAAAVLTFYLVRAWHASERLHRAEALNQAKLRFFTDISHEIRTPLTVIIAQVEALMQNQKFTPAQYSKILSVYQSSSQLRELITELLEFRRQEQGKLRLAVAPGNLVKLASEFYLVFEDYARGKGVALGVEKETDHLEVWYDRKQLQKVLRNLLSNAVKFTPSGGKVTISIGQKDGYAVLKVADTGKGIAPGDIDKVFSRFYSAGTDTRDFGEGTGIGLALAKGIVEAHHGTISVDSALGKGSVFTILLPLGYSHFSPDQMASEVSPHPEETPSGPVPDAPAGGERTILVVDDNESIRKLLNEVFSPFYRVLTASDGTSALEIVGKEMPDIVVTDVLMPGMSGTDLCRRIKADVSTCHIPVVLLTAQVAVEQNIEGLLTGADDYIAKPFNSRLLLSRCNNLVNSRTVLQEKFSRQPQVSSRMLATNEMDKEFLEKASRLVEENMDNPSFDVAMFSREMAMSRTSLFSKIKAVTGQTPNEFVVTMRLKKAAWLLKNKPQMSMSEIADMTGFSSAKYFSKCFFDVYHIRPLTYRKED